MFLLLSVVSCLCFKFRLKLKNTDKYMGGDSDRNPLLVPFEDADTYSFEKENGNQMTYIAAENKENKIFDIQKSNKKVTYWHNKKMMPNQLFIIALSPDGAYKIYVKGDCLGYSESKKFFRQMKCEDEDPNQSFEVVKIESAAKIRDLAGLSLEDKRNFRNLISKKMTNTFQIPGQISHVIRRTSRKTIY